jgi:hypothetical protein
MEWRKDVLCIPGPSYHLSSLFSLLKACTSTSQTTTRRPRDPSPLPHLACRRWWILRPSTQRSNSIGLTCLLINGTYLEMQPKRALLVLLEKVYQVINTMNIKRSSRRSLRFPSTLPTNGLSSSYAFALMKRNSSSDCVIVE